MSDFDPTGMTSAERQTYINDIRRRRLDGLEISDDELRNAIKCLRVERKSSGGNSRKTTATKAPAKKFTLDDL